MERWATNEKEESSPRVYGNFMVSCLGRAWPTEQPGCTAPRNCNKNPIAGLRTNLRGSTTYDLFLDSFVYFFFPRKNLTSGYSYRGWNVPRIRILGWLDPSFVEFRDYRASFIDKDGV